MEKRRSGFLICSIGLALLLAIPGVASAAKAKNSCGPRAAKTAKRLGTIRVYHYQSKLAGRGLVWHACSTRLHTDWPLETDDLPGDDLYSGFFRAGNFLAYFFTGSCADVCIQNQTPRVLNMRTDELVLGRFQPTADQLAECNAPPDVVGCSTKTVRFVVRRTGAWATAQRLTPVGGPQLTAVGPSIFAIEATRPAAPDEALGLTAVLDRVGKNDLKSLRLEDGRKLWWTHMGTPRSAFL